MMFHFHEGCMQVPDGWKDQTINIISDSGSAEPGITFTVTREPMPWGMEFEEYVETELKKATDALNEFEVIEKKNIDLSGHPARQVECTWLAKQGKMHQIITSVANDDLAMVITASSPGMMSDSQKKRLLATVQTFQFVDRTA